MSYLCNICGEPSPRGSPRRLHVIERTVQSNGHPRREIAREVPVCRLCDELLQGGATLNAVCQVRGRRQPPAQVVADAVASAPARQPLQFRSIHQKQGAL